ncbi:hypothetical protein A2926_01145 [Candidatus Giovannonibacteria bacterium RIFCSPLOWO2_01_FULL_44_40]|uniref:Uncharacterized protein n=1 Tax=Candidatus Giovannonibacteria bacterium RIFCSPHIGHO2_01_FULL_45_23 TaxID=1798325 RepID=A0A1F5VHX3_9BACT|nr:MAG: hypothetical protein A2834_03155 [Candidatus Giovannonibacteria bacterium RIFCSPHIGHO2_01_FULL_45_23]OGF75630.1 MAG: hypothetical protein A3C77_01015 [Candidatus Giovannonibacteria bacterium RIFCSPHIGHO2_02_FULL_45_13]OGF79540.1 MAG: hypothetical protein A2926_01145 [Candidatus Giovannonibacteria bacterium RIFCSPLOWO2_01_FULL_44_40]
MVEDKFLGGLTMKKTIFVLTVLLFLSAPLYMNKIPKKIAGWFALYLIPSNLTLSSGKLAVWYNTNGYFKFKAGDVIELKNRNIVGYGVRPKGKILSFKRDVDSREYYIVEMERDAKGNFFEWLNTGKVPENTERITTTETHFKWNIEHQFVKAAA